MATPPDSIDIQSAIGIIAAKSGGYVAVMAGAFIGATNMKGLTTRGRMLNFVQGTFLGYFAGNAAVEAFWAKSGPAVHLFVMFAIAAMGMILFPWALQLAAWRMGKTAGLIRPPPESNLLPEPVSEQSMTDRANPK